MITCFYLQDNYNNYIVCLLNTPATNCCENVLNMIMHTN